MGRRLFVGVLLLFAMSVVVCQSLADGLPEQRYDNWHRWRGPDGTGLAPHGNPPTKWDESTNIKWKVAIPGHGSGSPIVWGDKIFLLTAIKTERTADSAEKTTQDLRPSTQLVSIAEEEATTDAQEETSERSSEEQANRNRRRRRGGRRGGFGVQQPTNFHQFIVMCLNRHTGEVIWQQIANEVVPHEGHHGTSSFASSSPVTDGENLYVSFGSRGVYSYDLEGNLRWKRDLGRMSTRFSFGEGASPALYGDTLVIPWDHEGQSFIVALDANSGETRWQVNRDERTTWATPLILEYEGTVQVITNGTNRVRSYDLATGELIWECGGQVSNPIPTPIRYRDTVLCTTGHRGSALYAIPLDSQGDITGSDQIAWKLEENTPYVPSPILYEDLLFYTKANNAILSCVSAQTGEYKFKTKRLPDLDVVYASPVGAAGKLYFSGRNGSTVVVKAGPEYEELARNSLGETIDATPAIVGDTMYIRSENHLHCIAEE